MTCVVAICSLSTLQVSAADRLDGSYPADDCPICQNWGKIEFNNSRHTHFDPERTSRPHRKVESEKSEWSYLWGLPGVIIVWLIWIYGLVPSTKRPSDSMSISLIMDELEGQYAEYLSAHQVLTLHRMRKIIRNRNGLNARQESIIRRMYNQAKRAKEKE